MGFIIILKLIVECSRQVGLPSSRPQVLQNSI